MAAAQMFNAYSEMSIMVGGLAGFYKQRDSYFYPAWAASLPTALLRLPYSFVESLVLSCIIYFVSGLAPEAARWALLPTSAAQQQCCWQQSKGAQ